MISLRNSLKCLCAALIAGLLFSSFQVAYAQVAWKRGDQVDALPAEASSPGVSEVVEHRLLAPPTREQIASPGVGRSPAKRQAPKLSLPPMESFTTAAAGLAIVVGLFLVCAWMMRRAGPKPTTPLPSEAVAVLGRVPLAARNFAHLLQVGNKLVLVAITPDGVAPITEITDPLEVQRMLGLCVGNRKQSTSAEFHDVLEQLAKEPASGFLGNQAAASYTSQRR